MWCGLVGQGEKAGFYSREVESHGRVSEQNTVGLCLKGFPSQHGEN